MNYVDGEIAKRMMRLFPDRWGPKFWSGRFKEQLLSTVDAALNKKCTDVIVGVHECSLLVKV